MKLTLAAINDNAYMYITIMRMIISAFFIFYLNISCNILIIKFNTYTF